MIELILNLISAGLLAAGSIFALIGAFGLIRLPDFYTRLHSAGITDTLGAELILLGLMFQAGLSLVTVKLILISLFIFFTILQQHMVANVARVMGLKPMLVPDKDLENAEDR